MNIRRILKITLLYILTLSILISLVGCKKTFSLDDGFAKVNYNNIYQFAHSRFWVNENCVYYAKSGLYNAIFYFADKNGKHKITSDSAFKSDNGSSGEIYDIQAYGNNIYLLYKSDNGDNLFYLYSKNDETFKKLFGIKENVNDWAVVNNLLIYSAFLDDKDIDVNSLWYYDLNTSDLNQISAETIAFGIMKDKLCYVQKADANKCKLYNFDVKSEKSELRCSFDYTNKSYNEFNFTNNSVIFFKNGLSVLNVESGDLKNFSLPGYAKFMSCYEEYAFICLEKGLYKINLNTGESKLLFNEFDECNLVHAISDECAVIVCYENVNSLFGFSVKTYTVNSDGTAKELIEI